LAKGKEQLTAAPENAVIGESITALLESFQQMQVAQREAQAREWGGDVHQLIEV